MSFFAFPVAFLLLAATPEQLAPQPTGLRIAVLDLAPATPADEGLASAVTGALIETLAGLPQLPKGSTVVAQRELQALIGHQAFAQLLGCADERCSADLSKVVVADRVVAGRVGVVGGQGLLFLSLIDVKAGAVLARSSRVLALDAKKLINETAAAVGNAMLQPPGREVLRLSALSLLDPVAARATGDAPLQDLRLAVLFDEFGEDGQPLRMRPVETCAQKQLIDAGAIVVAPAVVQRLKGVAAPRSLIEGRVPEEFGTDEVDALVIGLVEYRAGAGFGGATSVEADLSLQLMKIDTGDVLASEQKQARHPGHTFNAAQKAAAERLCTWVGPQLQSAMQKRASRGIRVVVEVEGATADEAGAIATMLEKGSRVARIKVKSVTAKGAVLDAVLHGGDGLTLALELPHFAIGRPVMKASAGQITLGQARPVDDPATIPSTSVGVSR